MYADVESRGGILEPPGICEVKFRAADQISKMHEVGSVRHALFALFFPFYCLRFSLSPRGNRNDLRVCCEKDYVCAKRLDERQHSLLSCDIPPPPPSRYPLLIQYRDFSVLLVSLHGD